MSKKKQLQIAHRLPTREIPLRRGAEAWGGDAAAFGLIIVMLSAFFMRCAVQAGDSVLLPMALGVPGVIFIVRGFVSAETLIKLAARENAGAVIGVVLMIIASITLRGEILEGDGLEYLLVPVAIGLVGAVCYLRRFFDAKTTARIIIVAGCVLLAGYARGWDDALPAAGVGLVALWITHVLDPDVRATAYFTCMAGMVIWITREGDWASVLMVSVPVFIFTLVILDFVKNIFKVVDGFNEMGARSARRDRLTQELLDRLDESKRR